MLSSLRCLILCIGVAAACAGAVAQSTARLPPVTITGTNVRDPVEKSYRKMVRGMDLFERKRAAMAPQATLTFRLLPRKRNTDMNRIRVDVVGKVVDFNIPVSADGTFTLPRDRQALLEDAVVTPNRRALTMTWRTEIRTPGLPPGTRRLGDLRLECEVGLEAGLISNNRGILDRITDMIFGDTPEYCNGKGQRYLYFSDKALFNVTLAHAGRRQAVPVDRLYGGASADSDLLRELPFCDCEVLLDRTYFLPLADRSWPDDTLVEFEFMDDPPRPPDASDSLPLQRELEAVVIGSTTGANLASALGPMAMTRFDNGYTVGVLRGAPVRKDGDAPELVVLFAPSGQAVKARVRPADDATAL